MTPDSNIFSLSKDDVLSAMLGALLVVIVVSALCCIAKCNFSFLSRRRKRKLRAIERRKRARASGQAAPAPATVTVTDEKKPEAPPAVTKSAEKKVMAISKSNPQGKPEEKKPKSRKDLIIDIIDSALEGDICDNDFLNYSSSESIDRPSEEDQMLRRNSSNSLTLSLVFDTKTDRPIFRRL